MNIKKFKSYNESYIIGNEPLETSMKLRNKISKIADMLVQYENIVTSEMESDTDDYNSDIIDIKNEIRKIDDSFDSLEIRLGDIIHSISNPS